MKSLVLIRCPLMRRKRYLGLFKSSHKILGKMFLANIETSFVKNATFIHTSSFSKAQESAKFLCQAYDIHNELMLNINPNLQDLDIHGCIQLLKQTSNTIETVVLIAPGVTVSSLFSFLTGERKIFAAGSAELVKFPVTDWGLLNADSFDTGQIKVFKSA